MPNPKILKPGDLIRFMAMPDEWSRKGAVVFAEDITFMKEMIRRSWPSRIMGIDEYGFPWIEARIRYRGKFHIHTWGITESSGWRLVKHRK